VSGLAALTYKADLGSSLRSFRSELRPEEHLLQHTHFLDELLPTTKKRDKLFSFPARTEVLPDFFKGRAEALCGRERTKA
jgi:hypothetical protein